MSIETTQYSFVVHQLTRWFGSLVRIARNQAHVTVAVAVMALALPHLVHAKSQQERFEEARALFSGIVNLPDDLAGIAVSYDPFLPGDVSGWEPHFRLNKDGDMLLVLQDGGSTTQYRFPRRFGVVSKPFWRGVPYSLGYWQRRAVVPSFHHRHEPLLPFEPRIPRGWDTDSIYSWPFHAVGVIVSPEPPAIAKVALIGDGNTSVALLRTDTSERLSHLLDRPFKKHVLEPPARRESLSNLEKAAAFLIGSMAIILTADKIGIWLQKATPQPGYSCSTQAHGVVTARSCWWNQERGRNAL